MFDRRLLSFPGVRGLLCLCCAAAAVCAVASLAQALGLAFALDGLRSGGPLDAAAGPLCLFAAGFVLARAVPALQDALADRCAARIARRLKEDLLGVAFDGAGRCFERQGAGAFAQLCVEGTAQVHTYVRLIVPRTASVAVDMPLLIGAAFALDWVSGLIVVVVVPVIVAYLRLLGRQAKEAATAQLSQGLRLSGHFLDSVRGLPTLVAFGRDRSWARSVHEVGERFRLATMRTLRVATLSGAVLDLACTLTLAAVAVMLGFRLVDGSLSFLTAFTVLLLVPDCLAPLRTFASDFHATLDGRASLGRVLETAKGAGASACVRDGGWGAAAAKGAACAGSGSAEGSASERGADGDAALAQVGIGSALVARGVGLRYGDEAVLEGVSLRIPPRAKVALVGCSGAGKSSLLRALGGMERPDAGGFEDGSGRPIDLCCERWRARTAFMPQTAAVFSGTLRDNVAFYNPGADDALVERAVRAVGLWPLVESLPEGLATPVGREGRPLSGGQAQRVALARILAAPDRDVLLLDEPTASLDRATEDELAGALLAAMEGRTVVMATHRLHWVGRMDWAVVMEAGAVRAEGDPVSLERKGALPRSASSGARPPLERVALRPRRAAAEGGGAL